MFSVFLYMVVMRLHDTPPDAVPTNDSVRNLHFEDKPNPM